MPIEAASGLFRSEDMVKLDVIVPRDAVHDVVYHIGRTGVAQFLDQNKSDTAFARTFASELRRCDDLERRSRFFLEHIRAHKIELLELEFEPDLPANAIDKIERDMEALETSTQEAVFALSSLQADFTANRELLEVLQRAGRGGYDNVNASTQGLVQVAGVIPNRNVATLHRLVFRVSRGNALLHTDPIKEPLDEVVPSASGSGMSTQPVEKSVFLIYVSSHRLQEKIRKIADSLGARTIASDLLAKEPLSTVVMRLQTLESTMAHSDAALVTTLRRVAMILPTWMAVSTIEKGVYANLNLVKCTGSTAKALVWVPEQDINTLQQALALGCRRSGSSVAPVVQRSANQDGPPTYFRTNKITGIFQGLVDSYGVARYKEVNPAVFTMVTFPYLFGIMFGDMGHGVMLAIFGAFLIIFERRLSKINNEMFGMVFGGRYLIFLMGLFATYLGLLYNDFFGMSLDIFKSAYEWPALEPMPAAQGKRALPAARGIVHPMRPNGVPSVRPASVVAIGIDAAWSETENKLEFYNSVKMKCAIIVGVLQMLVGLVLSLLNHLRRKDWRHIWFGFIPEFLFLSCTFGYMATLIIVKWLTPWPNTYFAPSLLETMTNFFLKPGTVTAPLYAGQAGVQTFLLIVAFMQVPLLLLAIPFLEWQDSKRASQASSSASSKSAGPASGGAVARKSMLSDDAVSQAELSERQALLRAADDDDNGHSHHEEHGHSHDDDAGGHGSGAHGHGSGGGKSFDMGEVAIHYIIHTIEFVLGCVSNTASYLRLWALSLAHAQLSDVFLNFCLVKAIDADSGYGIVLFLGVSVWLAATIGVLLMMESLSAFLHALRLHWVEFQSKFFAADGTAFLPFDLFTALKLERA